MSLQKYPGSDLNKISKTLQDYLDSRKLGAKGIAKYRLLNGTRNIDPQRAKGDDMLYPSSVAIPLATQINDDGNVVQIGVVKHFDDATKRPVFRKFTVQPTKGDNGIFMIRGNVVTELEVYDALELSNLNGSNPYRDVSFPVVFERVDEAKESKVKSDKRNVLVDSILAIRRWTAQERQIMAAGYNISPSLDADVLKDRLEELAAADPETFYKSIDSEDMKVRALIKLSTDAGIINYVAHENKWEYTGSKETIALLDRREGVNEFEQFTQFLKSSAQGLDVQKNLEKILKANKK